MVLTKAELISSLQNEVNILVHLCGKLDASAIDFRPTPKQRSSLELLRYLTVMGPALTPAIKNAVFDRDGFQAAMAAANEMDFAATVASLQSQSAFYAEAIGAMSDDELRAEIDLFGSGAKMSRGQWLVNWVLCGHAAYRTQLFGYLKLCGREELNTMNLWMGIDPPQK
jgi:hypothetical protein